MVGLGRLRVSSWGVVGLVIGIGWVPVSFADSFYLKSGNVVEADVLQATRNTVMLRAGGSILPTSLMQIERVVLSLADGGELSGEFLGWKDGVYEIRSDGRVLQVQDGQVIEDEATKIAAPAVGAESTPTPDLPEPKPSVAVAMQGLPELTLRTGQVVVGRIIHATSSIVTIRQQDGGIFPTSRAHIETVRFLDENGSVLGGKFANWEDGVYRLKSDEQELLASLSDEAAARVQALLPVQANSTPSEEPAIAAIEATDAAAAPKLIDGPDDGSDESTTSVPSDGTDGTIELDENAGAGGPANETAVAGLQKSELTKEEVATEESVPAGPDGPRLVEPRVVDAAEDSGAVVFEFHLDKPADRTLVVLYAATDDTAQAGQDYEAKSGVITFGAGSEYAEVRVPLIDDEQPEDSEQFRLFLSGDPEIIRFSQRQVPATINDND